jgi:hypothetical protein
MMISIQDRQVIYEKTSIIISKLSEKNLGAAIVSLSFHWNQGYVEFCRQFPKNTQEYAISLYELLLTRIDAPTFADSINARWERDRCTYGWEQEAHV